MLTREARDDDLVQWVRLRHPLWPDSSRDAHRAEAAALLAAPDEVCFLLINDTGEAVGFAEAAIRSGPSGPYGHLEGWYVEPQYRGQGLGQELVGCVEQWCLHRAIRMLTSDTTREYPLSPDAHARAGFRKIHEFTIFMKELRPRRPRASDPDTDVLDG